MNKAPYWFNVILYSRNGSELASNMGVQGMKQAKEFARHYLSDAFANLCETTHATMQTAKVAIFAEGNMTGPLHACEWDKEHPQHAARVRAENEKERKREAIACLKQDLQTAELALSRLNPGEPGVWDTGDGSKPVAGRSSTLGIPSMRVTKYRPVCDLTLPRLEAKAERAGIRSSVFRHAARDACGWKGETIRVRALDTLARVLRS